MSYEPYRPGPTEPEDTGSHDSRPDTPSYETYPAPPPPDAPPPAASAALKTPSAGPPPYHRGGRSNSGAGVVVGLVLGVVVLVGAVSARQTTSDTTDTTDRDTYVSCAAEHDEDGSLFSDEEWCDLELMGGNGNGLADEGGDGGPVEENSLFGDDDPIGYP